MATRRTPRNRSVAKTKTEDGLADKIAITVGTTLGRLMNRKDALLEQLSEVETKIADASRRAGGHLKSYLPTIGTGLEGTRKVKKPVARSAGRSKRSSHKPPVAPSGHGPDDATAETMRAAGTSSGRPRRATASPRSAPRATGKAR